MSFAISTCNPFREDIPFSNLQLYLSCSSTLDPLLLHSYICYILLQPLFIGYSISLHFDKTCSFCPSLPLLGVCWMVLRIDSSYIYILLPADTVLQKQPESHNSVILNNMVKTGVEICIGSQTLLSASAMTPFIAEFAKVKE